MNLLQLNRYRSSLWVALVPIFWTLPSLAQTPDSSLNRAEVIINSPDLIPPTTDPLPPPTLLPPLEDLLPEMINPGIFQPEDIPGEIWVRQFEVLGSTVFSPQELTKLLQPFIERPISFAELLEAANSIANSYQEKGYITSGAFIPEQSIQDGVVQIQVIEGEIEAINIEGVERLQPGYLKQRLALASRSPVQRDRLLAGLQLLQLNPLIRNLEVNLGAGSRPGQSILDVTVTEAEPTRYNFTIDNQRSPSVGSVRRVAQFSHNNLLGFGDRFSVGYINTRGSNTLDNLSYTIPLNARNGTLELSHSRSRNNITENPFNLLNISSKSFTYQLTYRQPLRQTITDDLAIGLTGSWQRNQSFLGLDNIGGFPFTAGSDLQGRTTVTALRFFQEYSRRTNQDVFAVRSQFNLGINALDATIDRGQSPDGRIPDSQFLSWRLQAQYLRLLAPDTLLLLRSDFQWADQGLLAFEQFSLGGMSSVRGYRQDFLSADNGLFASAELRIPVARVPEWDALIQISPFLDFGTVWNRTNGSSNATNQTSLASVGLGLNMQVGSNLSARLDWGIGLINKSGQTRSLQEKGVYFSLNYRL